MYQQSVPRPCHFHGPPTGTHSPPYTQLSTLFQCKAHTLSSTARHKRSCTQYGTASHTRCGTLAWWWVCTVSVFLSCTPSHTQWCKLESRSQCTQCPKLWHTLSCIGLLHSMEQQQDPPSLVMMEKVESTGELPKQS